jgi:glucose-1-phosphate thymidylyltransferase
LDFTDVIGLIPAAGYARRLPGMQGSKEILPVAFPCATPGAAVLPPPQPACHCLLQQMRAGGIGRAFIVLRDGKWDIPARLGDGRATGVSLAYVVTDVPFGAPYSLDQAYPFVRDARVALGFPDLLFTGDDAYARVIAAQTHTGADIVLGLFPTDLPHTADVVEMRSDRVTRVTSKPALSGRHETWGIAVWRASFTEYMHRYLARRRPLAAAHPELHVGQVIQAAATAGLDVRGIRVSDEPFLDIGMPENLARVRPTPGDR